MIFMKASGYTIGEMGTRRYGRSAGEKEDAMLELSCGAGASFGVLLHLSCLDPLLPHPPRRLINRTTDGMTSGKSDYSVLPDLPARERQYATSSSESESGEDGSRKRKRPMNVT